MPQRPATRRHAAHRLAGLDALPRPAQLTARQRQILDWIRGYLETAGMPPTRAEIATGLGFSSASSAEDHLQALARKGAIEMLPGAARGLRLKEMPGMPLQGALPLVGRVAAGHPILAVENVESHYRVDPALFSPRADYLLRVHGESMQDAGILDRDLLAVHRTREARNGQIVVARVGGPGGDEVTVKRFRKRGREIVLLPENAAFDPIVVDPRTTPFAIEGIGVGLVRSGTW
jgi:repressor LexA